jgi:Mn-dependent DtxR family transcriptional regulator
MEKVTKDELYLLKLLELASEGKENVDCYQVGKLIGQKEHTTRVIVRDLAQANFIRKGEGDEIYLTTHGHNVATQIKNER